jgi:hypothetical protein
MIRLDPWIKIKKKGLFFLWPCHVALPHVRGLCVD